MTPQPAITEAQVAQIVARRKFVSAIVKDNCHPSHSERSRKDYVLPNEKTIIWELRYADMREKAVNLQFHARLETPLSGGIIKPRPGVSLKWKGVRIRGVNWSILHDNMDNGLPIAPVRKWHEKVWTDADQDKHIVEINNEIRNTDFRSIIEFCCDRWNIELPEDRQLKMG